MKLLNRLRDLGLSLRLHEGQLAATGVDRLAPAQVEAVRANKALLVADLVQEGERVEEMIRACRSAAARFPEEAAGTIALLEGWRDGVVTERVTTFGRVRAFFVKAHGLEPLEGEALAAALRDVFPSKKVSLSLPTTRALDLDALAPVAPKQEAMAL